jgi:hypothetical protein
MPPASRLMRPARSINLWLMISASLGASFSVEMKKREARMVGVFAVGVWKAAHFSPMQIARIVTSPDFLAFNRR